MTPEVEHTEDGRHIVVGGRRWRASDPGIPDRLRQELVDELMAARRAVRTIGDAARARVQDAKIALGERGEPWWEEPSTSGRADRLAAAARTLLRHRRPEATICPSDIARAVAAELRHSGIVRVTQRGRDVDPATAKGPVRIGRGPRWPSD